MLAREIANLEHENKVLRDALEELNRKMEKGSVAKPKSCQYCRNYIQYYRKSGTGHDAEYVPIRYGHCISGVPICKGGKKRPVPEDTCPYFELGTRDTRSI